MWNKHGVVGPQRFCNGDISNRPRVPGYDKSLEQPNTQTQEHIQGLMEKGTSQLTAVLI